MSNRSHKNAAHIGMNSLRKRGLQHASEIGTKLSFPEKTYHVVWVGDCLKSLSQIPNDSIQLIICDPPYNINVLNGTILKTMLIGPPDGLWKLSVY